MSFKAGAIVGEARLDTKKWDSGLKRITKGAAVAVAAIGTAFVAGMTKAVIAANEFQKEMSNVATLIDTSAESTQDLTKQLLLLDPALGGTTELTKGLYQAFSAGARDAEEAMEITVASAKFAKAALTDTNTAVDVLTTAINAYGAENMDANKASDIFFTTIKKGKITGEELASSIGTSIPLFSAAKIGLDELASGIAAMTKQGVSANVATTQLNNIVSSFLKPSEELAIRLKEVGFESGSAFLEAEGLAGALEFLQEVTKGDAAEIAKLIPNIRGMRGVMALTGVGGETFTDTLEAMAKAVGATTEAFEKQEKVFNTYKNSAAKLELIIGNIGKLFVDEIAAGATKSTESMIAFLLSSEGMDTVANIAGSVAGAFQLIYDTVTPLLAIMKDTAIKIWEPISEALKTISLEGGGASIAFKVLAGVVNVLSAFWTVQSTIIVGLIKHIVDLGLAIGATAKLFGIWFETLLDPSRWGEVDKQFTATVDSFIHFGKRTVESVETLIETTVDQFSGFGERVEKTAEDMELSFTLAVNKTADTIKRKWLELITGQDDLAAAIAEGVNKYRAAILEGNKDASESTNVLMEEFRRLRLTEQQRQLEDLAIQTMNFANAGVDEIELAKWVASEKLRIAEEARDSLEITWKNYADKIVETMSIMSSAMSSIISQAFTNILADAQLEHQEEQASLQRKFDAGLISEEEYEIKRAEIDQAARDKKNEIEEEAFTANKINKIAGIWIDAASAIVGWISAAPILGPVAGPIFAGIMSGLTLTAAGIQTGLIASQTFVPSKQEGGMASGLTRVHEAGGEIITLPDNSQVIPSDISRQIASASGNQGTTVNVSFAGAQISDAMDLKKVTRAVAKQLGRELRLAT